MKLRVWCAEAVQEVMHGGVCQLEVATATTPFGPYEAGIGELPECLGCIVRPDPHGFGQLGDRLARCSVDRVEQPEADGIAELAQQLLEARILSGPGCGRGHEWTVEHRSSFPH